MEPARKFQDKEEESLFFSPITQEKQTILHHFQLIALEKQNRRLKAAVIVLSLLLLAAILSAGYLYHRMQLSGRAGAPERQKGLSSLFHGSAPSSKSATVRPPEGETADVQRETLDQKGEAKASIAETLPVITVNYRGQDRHGQPDETGKSDQDTGTPASTPAASPEAAPESAAQPEGAALATGAEPAARYVGSKTSNRYHFPDCKWAKLIQPERLLGFASVEEARKTHPIACPACRPPVAEPVESAAAVGEP